MLPQDGKKKNQKGKINTDKQKDICNHGKKIHCPLFPPQNQIQKCTQCKQHWEKSRIKRYHRGVFSDAGIIFYIFRLPGTSESPYEHKAQKKRPENTVCINKNGLRHLQLSFLKQLLQFLHFLFRNPAVAERRGESRHRSVEQPVQKRSALCRQIFFL